VNIDLCSLTVDELDALILTAARHRAERMPPRSTAAPASIDLVLKVAYAWTVTDDGTVVLQFFHPGYGWLGFLLSESALHNLTASIAAAKPDLPHVRVVN
jgi:hypothetical protein